MLRLELLQHRQVRLIAALQPADPTLDSVTDNGSNYNKQHYSWHCKFAISGNNVATGGTAIAIGGAGNTASGSNSDNYRLLIILLQAV